ncbi:hypothetical protein Cs7R123_15440 [Catellatospora sp. TT07R-123]|uniref:GNAT family N-acetyltransferase n=1 Tax=Catellatospora sp. TT07R-123 TaxID=2733863 RepID=UPI001B224A58|nr:GNAT family N-acetyltransferase [Catellatospora sp. TT07R-123]GHJ44202.1 hypothetical protein Cs7R123_15440 [Catellatospora sp. TT07R-123]
MGAVTPRPTALRRALARRRYDWTSGAGSAARLHGWWDSRPGRRYLNRLITAAPPDGTPGGVSLAYRGFAEGPHYVLTHLRAQVEQHGGGPAEIVDLPPRRWPGLLDQQDADLLVVGCSTARARSLPTERSVLLPYRIDLNIEVDEDPEVMRKRVSGNERRQFAKLRRERDWAWKRTRDPEDLLHFWERMHLPTMAGRHGADTRSTDWVTAQECLFGQGRLFFVTEEAKPVAGVLCRWEPETRSLTMRLLGVLDGDEAHYRSGAVKAVYYLAIEWACDNGVRWLGLAGGESFPGVGVFQFKRRFHPTVGLPVDHQGGKALWLRVQRDTPAVRDLLVDTPMFGLTPDGRLEAVYFADADRPARTSVTAASPGVDGVRMIDLDEFLNGR